MSSIVIVDDSPHVRKQLEIFLKSDGFKDLQFEESATDMFNYLNSADGNSKTTLILLDIEMPGMDGIEACKKIKNTAHLCDIPVIMVTGKNDTKSLQLAFDAGAMDYVTKPINKVELIVRVKSILTLKQEMEKRKLREKELEDTLIKLKQSQEQLIQSEKLASLGQLVTGVAHEMNTPIGIVITSSSYLKKITGEIVSSFGQNVLKRSELENYFSTAIENFDIITSNLLRIGDLIKSFKMVSVDQIVLDKRRFNIKNYIEEMLISLSPTIKKTPHQININCPSDIEIESYPGAFAQIITNLVINSLTHAYEKSDKGVIFIDISMDKTKLIMKYTDDGKGINQVHLKKIFDPFFTTNRSNGNTGLGLNIVFNLVHQTLKGTIFCSSIEGSGTTFILELPIDTEIGDGRYDD
ncbi:MAG: response regulator [Candidatus Magnetoovum sp. WYHC-5]|nr:response regulator [Candidatus Magnetoovum sp. WYHC-5]